MVPEALFKPVEITSRFGSYSASVEWKENRLYYYRRLLMEQGSFPASAFREFIDFRQKTEMADRLMVILKERSGTAVK
ncbi:hypothetical protein [Larkinella soli]|uniref:hypothetical protein n=1 Tax=Larkinella soli TaxID=1770527 RepID=UPI000FFBC0AA|nr:hypothetical protein [Larkinella soli]